MSLEICSPEVFLFDAHASENKCRSPSASLWGFSWILCVSWADCPF